MSYIRHDDDSNKIKHLGFVFLYMESLLSIRKEMPQRSNHISCIVKRAFLHVKEPMAQGGPLAESAPA
jgi:hypothetical protein